MHKVVPLPRELYQGYPVPFSYDTDLYYDVRIHDTRDGFSVDFALMPFPQTQHKAFTGKLYEPHWEAPQAHGILENDALIAAIEYTPEMWNNRLRVTNLWIAEAHRQQGLGRLLMDQAKAFALESGRRAIILETQSCNVGAVRFYFAQGFTLAGLDAYSYSNSDIERKEVRMELIYFPNRRL